MLLLMSFLQHSLRLLIPLRNLTRGNVCGSNERRSQGRGWGLELSNSGRGGGVVDKKLPKRFASLRYI